jgi:lipopolysaccharide/colanic/teichoic acid biosynthesis glycosyltransferase
MLDTGHFARFSVPPGLTGLWQVSGRNTLTMKQGLELDVEYVRRQGLALDLWILLKTIPVVLSTHGAL